MQSTDLSNSPADLRRESLKLVNSLLEIKSSAFYREDPNLQHRGLVTHNLAYFRDFLKPMDLRYVVDMFFREHRL